MKNLTTKTKKQELLKLLYLCEDNLIDLKYSDKTYSELKSVIDKVERELQDQIELK